MTRLPLIALALMTPTASWPGPSAVPLTYEQFEISVPHFDLESCPAQLAADNTFCRATFHSEEIHVFAFSEDGDSPMTGFASYPADGLAALLE